MPRSDAAPPVVQFRAFVFDVAAPALDRLDGGLPLGAAAGRRLRDRLLPRERDLHRLDLGTDRPARNGRDLAQGAQAHAAAIDRDTLLVRARRSRRAQIPDRRSWHMYLLPDRLSAARSARRRDIAPDP